MMPRNALMLLIACSLYARAACAGGPIPAVNLPSAVPESVRDLTARSLAATRDTLSDAIHPFRGEFHGLGTPEGGSSYATDLSANGRVVVGAERIGNGYNQAFVWSPWTGRTAYDMESESVSGSITPASISADGVYVAGHAIGQSDKAFRWSLAGSEQIASTDYPRTGAAATSSDGQIVVGTASSRRPWVSKYRTDVYEDGAFFLGDLQDDDTKPISQAYRYTNMGGIDLLSGLPGYRDSEAVDVSSDGTATLVNGHRYFSFGKSTAPFLWKDDGIVQPLGQANNYGLNLTGNTTATAISADGSTVVGSVASSGDGVYYNGYLFGRPSSHAVLWREGTGWVDLRRERTVDDIATSSQAVGISADGSVVLGTNQAFRHTQIIANIGIIPFVDVRTGNFIWDEQRGMRDLTDVLQLDYGLEFTGWDLGEATAISDDGTTIIGNGTNPEGEREAWRAVLQRETPHGDLDFDGDIDQFDYQTLVGNLGLTSESSSVFYADGDLNADGVVDQQDADTVLALYEHRRWGDFNADGVVDVRDYTVWRDHFGNLSGIADANGDGRTTAADLAAWRSHYGRVIEQTLGRLIPEPSALVLLGMLGAGIAAVRRVGGQIDS